VAWPQEPLSEQQSPDRAITLHRHTPPPVYVAPACYWTGGEPVWGGDQGVWTYPAVRVCE